MAGYYFLRYPGGKSKILNFIKEYLPKEDLTGTYFEPFVGGGSLYWYLKPTNACISDLNKDLIDLYKAVKWCPHKVWEIFNSFPSGKESYYKIRDTDFSKKRIWHRAAKTLYLNRTCFKGMWRHNPQGKFNVGYGGEARRWVISHESLVSLSKYLKSTKITCNDYLMSFEDINDGDFIFLDPPYKPGKKEMTNSHYINGKFSFEDQKRLAKKLLKISRDKSIKWMMTNSNNIEILNLYSSFNIIQIPKGTGDKIGVYDKSGEALITNYTV